MNGRISRLPVAMVSVGLVRKAVTRQLEKDQDKGKLVRGRCQCVSRGMRWEGDRIRDRHRDRGTREIRTRRDERDIIEKAETESSKQEGTAEVETHGYKWASLTVSRADRLGPREMADWQHRFHSYPWNYPWNFSQS